MAPPSVEVIDLAKTYTSGKAVVEAVRGVSFTVEEGEIFSLLGPNGAGKSTTILMLVTLLQPSSGRATVAGFDLATEGHRIRQAVGAALQETGLDKNQKGREILELHCGLVGYRGADRDRRVGELLDIVGLQDSADRFIRTYSGGMRRRLDLALALVNRPRIVFLDEPTTGLDPASRRLVWAEVEKMRQTGTTVFLTTQYLEEADSLSDRIAIVDYGEIVAAGTPQALKQRLGSELVIAMFADGSAAAAAADRLGGVVVEEVTVHVTVEDGAAAIPVVVSALQNAALHPTSLVVHQPTLDDVFLEVTGHKLEGVDETVRPEEVEA